MGFSRIIRAGWGNHPCSVWRSRISLKFHGAQKRPQRLISIGRWALFEALIRPPVSSRFRGGPRGPRGPGTWELESMIWRPPWESNLREQSGEKELESMSWRAPWGSNLGEQSEETNLGSGAHFRLRRCPCSHHY